MPGAAGDAVRTQVRRRLRGQLPRQPDPDRIQGTVQRPRIRHQPQQVIGGHTSHPISARARQLREQLKERRAGGFHIESFSPTTDIPDSPNIAPDQAVYNLSHVPPVEEWRSPHARIRAGSWWQRGGWNQRADDDNARE